jgi:hypothetical protein
LPIISIYLRSRSAKIGQDETISRMKSSALGETGNCPRFQDLFGWFALGRIVKYSDGGHYRVRATQRERQGTCASLSR